MTFILLFQTFQKVQVDPIQYKLQQANGVGQGLIQSAAKNANTQGLEHDLDETNIRWNTLNKKVGFSLSFMQSNIIWQGEGRIVIYSDGKVIEKYFK